MPSGVEEEQQTRFPVTEKIAGAAPVNPAILIECSSVGRPVLIMMVQDTAKV